MPKKGIQLDEFLKIVNNMAIVLVLLLRLLMILIEEVFVHANEKIEKYILNDHELKILNKLYD
jgi:hypothetical protein